jgi:hypothetical protein
MSEKLATIIELLRQLGKIIEEESLCAPKKK